jgi:Flp pilus assembly pilin Flp
MRREHKVAAFFGRLLRDDDGQDLAEYALLLLFIAIAAMTAVSILGLSVGGMWGSVLSQLATAL